MLNDENTPEIEQDENTIDTNSEETTEETHIETEEKDWEAEAKKLRAILDRQKKKQVEAKAAPAVPPINNNQLSEELKLIAKGLSDEEIEQLKVISKGKGVSLSEALKDPLFEAHQKVEREKARREEAKLGASKGSGQTEKESFRHGMTDDEHKALWKKQNN